ncbi:MAG: DUF484 family protein [Pseudomonadota bacterium]
MSTSKTVKQLKKSDQRIENEQHNQETPPAKKEKIIKTEFNSEEAVAQYLSNHPDFFQNKDNLIEKLTINHASGQAISLIERQVNILRSQNNQLDKQLSELFSIAKENEHSTQKMHNLILSLLSCQHLHDVASLLQSRLVKEFSVDSVSLKLFSADNVVLDSNNTICIDKQSAQAKILMKIIHKREPVCGFFKELNPQELPTKISIASMAVMPLFVDKNNCFGTLVLGSEDKQHFKPENGTLFLKNLAEIVSYTLVRYL